MTGLERRSDIVAMAAYAPLLVNTHNRGWDPDLIVFDNHRQAHTSLQSMAVQIARKLQPLLAHDPAICRCGTRSSWACLLSWPVLFGPMWEDKPS